MSVAIQNRIVDRIIDLGSFGRFMYNSFVVSLVCCFRPSTYPLFWNQIYVIGVRSVFVMMITGGFVGMLLGVQVFDLFAAMGMEEKIGGLINTTGVRELGPVLAAVMLAGRIGGALTAELGTMKVTEQIDALRSMGADPIKYLVAPRILACLVLTPLLIVYADIMCSFGGYVMSIGYNHIPAKPYWEFTANFVDLWDLNIGVVKGFFFGAAIAIISCYKGFTCKKGAEGVGQACTEAFVLSLMSILGLDFIIAVIEKAVYLSFWPLKSALS